MPRKKKVKKNDYVNTEEVKEVIKEEVIEPVSKDRIVEKWYFAHPKQVKPDNAINSVGYEKLVNGQIVDSIGKRTAYIYKK